MLPESKENIYPKTEVNVKALISYYFDQYDIDQEGAVAAILMKTSLSLNQVEYILRKISEAYVPVFRKHFPRGVALNVLFSYYGVGAFERGTFKGSKSAELIFAEFLNFLEQTEKT